MILTIIRVLIAVFLYTVGAVVLGLALFPAMMLCRMVWQAGAGQAIWQQTLSVALAVGASYFIFGFSLMAVAAIFRFLLRLDLREGEYSMASFGALKWYITNAIQLLVWSLFGDFLLLTPFASLFYRLMGAKLGLNTQINSKYCADLSLMEIGDNAVIGGHATVIGHSFERGKLILKRVRIGRNAIVGLNAIVLPGVELGERAVIGAGVFVPKDTKIASGTTYVGKQEPR